MRRIFISAFQMCSLIHVFLTRDKDIKVSEGQDKKSESAQLLFK